MASLAKLSKDMNDAQRMVGGAMGNVEKSVASAKRAMQALGVGLPLVAITDQVRRMTDQYTKLDAQLRLSTRSQAEYARGMADIRRISSIAQADLSSTSMLYTRLLNVMKGTGVEQSKLATVTETVSFGLKAYGATAQEASSAALQLSQAMGANRLGGEEFRAVMEAMPNVMKVVADSMGVPLGELRQLSIDGKITADVLVKALGDPAIAAQFKAMAMNAQTVTGAWIVARNELMLLVGEFMKSSGATSGAIAAFNGIAVAIRFLADNLGVLLNALYAYVTVMGGKLVVGLVQARMAQMALNAAHGEALLVNLAMARAEAANALVARDVAAARAWQTGVTTGLTAANKRLAAATVEVTAAEKLASASSIGIAGKIKGAVGKTGWIGLALFGIWSVVDFLNGMQDIADGAKKTASDLADLSLQQVMLMRQEQTLELYRMKHAFMGADRYRVEIRDGEARLKMLDDQVTKLAAVADAEMAAQRQKVVGTALTHDEVVVQQRMIELSAQFNDNKLTEAEYLKRVNEELYGHEKVVKQVIKAQDDLNTLREASIKYEQDIIDGINAETDALLKKIEQERFDTEAIGKTAEQLALLQSVRYDNVTSLLEQKLATLEAVYASEAEIAAIRDQIKARKELKGVWETQAAAQVRDAEKKAWKEIWDSVDKTAHDTFVSILNGGKDTATRLKEAFKNGFFDWLYSMTLKKWIVNISAVGTGTGVSGAAMAGTSGGGGGGMFQIPGLGVGNFISGIGNAIGSSMLSLGGAGMSLGWGAASEAAAAYSAAGMGMEAASLQIGAAMPYIGAAVAAISVLGNVFGGGGTPTSSTGNALMVYDPTGKQTQKQTFYGGSSAATDATIAGMQQAYMQAAMSLGIQTVATRFQYGGNTGRNGQNPQFALGGGAIGGPFFYQGETSLNDAAVQLAASRAVFAALQGSDLPAYLANMFNGLSAGSMTKEQIDNTLAFAQSVKQMRDALVETRTPIEIFRQNVADGMQMLGTSAATFRTDFVAAIDAGISPEAFVRWQQLGNAMDQLSAAEAQLASSWQSLTDAIFAEVARIRGLTSTPSGSMAQFTTLTAMARAGDQNAAKLLPGVARAMLDVAAMTAANATDLARLQGRTAASLEGTGLGLASKYGLTIPAFAAGGTHTGGLRLVGENGPELEYTGPSAIFSNGDSRNMLDNSGVVASVDALREELRALGLAIAAPIQKQYKLFDKWDGQGMPEVREA